jgi:prepilin-type N-terminal cleavage/methylation domain-containing protein
MKQNGNQCGFTLIEMILVMSIMGLVSMVAFPQITDSNSLNSLTLHSLADKVRNDLVYARQLSKATGEIHGLRVVGTETYEVFSTKTDQAVVSPYTQKAMIESLQDTFGPIQFLGNDPELHFSVEGRLSENSPVAALLIQLGSKQIEISVNSETGRVAVAEVTAQSNQGSP